VVVESLSFPVKCRIFVATEQGCDAADAAVCNAQVANGTARNFGRRDLDFFRARAILTGIRSLRCKAFNLAGSHPRVVHQT
jgi:hypothetical protein